MAFLWGILSFYLGSVFASFAYVLAMRLPAGEPLDTRSHCENCNMDLRFVDVLPVFGYLLNQGTCHYCHEPIKGRHIIVELVGGVFFLGAFLVFGFLSWEFFVSCVLITVLIAEAMADIEEGIVIDRIWMVGWVLIVGVRIIQTDFFPYLWSSLGLFAVMLGLLVLGKFLFKKDALGGGDVKLYLFIGFALTFYEGLLSIFLAALFGLVYALIQKKQFGHPLRFVPAIALAAVLCHWFAADAIAWYLALLGV